jgi:uncharacterized protein YwqG
MFTVLFFAIVIAAFIAILYLMNRYVWQPKLRKEAEAAPRVTLAEVQSFWNDIEEGALPIAKATVQDRPPLTSQESRIGGAPLAIGNEAIWPRNANSGFPMALVAQINFSDLPKMGEFPERGILQVFSSFEMIEDTGASDRVVRWDPDPQTDELLEIPSEIRKSKGQTSGYSEAARCIGLPLTFAADTAPSNPYNWPFEEKDPIYENRLPESEEVAAILEDWEDRKERISTGYGDHWVGGHPRFVQYDVRGENSACQHLDRVLFHLGNANGICVGDAGELNVMISREALQKRNFQDAYLTWDCS